MNRPKTICTLLLAFAGTSLWFLRAEDILPEPAPAADSIEVLIRRDPFLPPNFGAGRPAPAPVQMPRADPIDRQFRLTGMINLGGQQRFNFVDLRSGKGFWLALNESSSGLQVISYDPSSQRVSVRHGGQTGSLELKRPELPLSNPPPATPPATATQPDPNNPIPPIPNVPEDMPTPPSVNQGRDGVAPPAPPVRRRIIVPGRQNTGA